MKIAIRGGHSLDVRGAKGIVDEVTEDRKITVKVIEYLKQLENEVLDVTPNDSKTSSNDLTVAVSKANAWKADYFVSIHLNAFNEVAHGTEVLYKSDKGKVYADRIVSKLVSLGFMNRGAKADVRGLYEFKACAMPNNIIEVFFCDNKEDIDLYNKLGIDIIAKAIAEGITGKLIPVSSPTVSQEDIKNGIKFRKSCEVICDTLNCRKSPINGDVITTFNKGDKLTFVDYNSDKTWGKIVSSKFTGWICLQYVKIL